MKKSFSLIALLLCVVLVFPAVFAGCASDSENDDADVTSPETGANVTGDGGTTYADDLGNADMGGTTIKFITRVEDIAKNEITEEENIHEVINDAVHDRNLRVQERLNCVIDNKDQIVGDVDEAAFTIVQNLFKAGHGDYDVYVANSFNSVMSAYNGHLTDLNRCDDLDLTKPYWSQGFNQAVSVGKSQFLCTGPFSMAFYRYMFVTLFNKDTFDKHGVDYPYEKVENGEWTLEYQAEIAKTFYADNDGVSGKTDGDNFGFVISAGDMTCMTDGFWTSCGLGVAVKNEDNFYEYSVDVERFDTAIGNILKLTDGDGSLKLDCDDTAMFKKFTDGEAAMVSLRLISVEDAKFRNMGTYGILPMAKLNAGQSGYFTHEQDQFLVYAIPGYISNEERINTIGTFLEAFASESYTTVTPAYYEIALTSKYVNDEDSVKMLDKIAEGVHFDASSIYIRLFGFNTTNFRTYVSKSVSSISGKLKGAENSIKKSIEKVNKAYEKLGV